MVVLAILFDGFLIHTHLFITLLIALGFLALLLFLSSKSKKEFGISLKLNNRNQQLTFVNSSQKKWFVIYTKPNNELKVSDLSLILWVLITIAPQ